MTISCLPIANSTLSAEPVRTFRLDSTRYRNYHPTLGRWVERDPKGYGDGMGLHQYVRSNPPGLLDPYGLLSWLDKLKIKLGLKDKEVKESGVGFCGKDDDLVLEKHKHGLQWKYPISLPDNAKCEGDKDVGKTSYVGMNYVYEVREGSNVHRVYYNVKWEVVCVCCGTQEDPYTIHKFYGWKLKQPPKVVEKGWFKHMIYESPAVANTQQPPDDPFGNVRDWNWLNDWYEHILDGTGWEGKAVKPPSDKDNPLLGPGPPAPASPGTSAPSSPGQMEESYAEPPLAQ